HFYHPTPLYRIFSLNTRKKPPKGDLFRQAEASVLIREPRLFWRLDPPAILEFFQRSLGRGEMVKQKSNSC
ncbi:MAG: hypothetical protein ACLUNG_11445, partial [[Clostridium] leptum]